MSRTTTIHTGITAAVFAFAGYVLFKGATAKAKAPSGSASSLMARARALMLARGIDPNAEPTVDGFIDQELKVAYIMREIDQNGEDLVETTYVIFDSEKRAVVGEGVALVADDHVMLFANPEDYVLNMIVDEYY